MDLLKLFCPKCEKNIIKFDESNTVIILDDKNIKKITVTCECGEIHKISVKNQ
jgi:RNase P subunit RPR2